MPSQDMKRYAKDWALDSRIVSCDHWRRLNGIHDYFLGWSRLGCAERFAEPGYLAFHTLLSMKFMRILLKSWRWLTRAGSQTIGPAGALPKTNNARIS